ncbi:hypothetical protein [Nonomuraea jiangxiensis]|uniref:Uncharacterized protein n=1 Tax=Nonomuraea jiangxiensis TaxID=633440 RepID=A0A1G8RUV8_9ACTN|nr:hypothetical protein [Nonomuraea jiangxiensis]SDJ20742.1 hypothetical protein SAMN05421869_109191 [Nonomuraea jiangxiensis]
MLELSRPARPQGAHLRIDPAAYQNFNIDYFELVRRVPWKLTLLSLTGLLVAASLMMCLDRIVRASL